jgi:hypothetical protein
VLWNVGPLVAWLAVVGLLVRVAYPAMPAAASIFGVLCTVGVLVHAAGCWMIRDARGDATLGAIPFMFVAVVLTVIGVLVLGGAYLLRLLGR